MPIYVIVKNDDDHESAVIGVTNVWHQDNGTMFTEPEVELNGGESRRFVVQPDNSLSLNIREVHERCCCPSMARAE